MNSTIKILKKEVPAWIRNLCYILMLLETILVVIVYHKPDLFLEIIVILAK